jgi:hypothetical protein
MKKILLIALLFPLLLFEVYLCTAFLPVQWQHAIDRKMLRVLPESHDWTPVTHPNLDQEIDQVLREHIWLRIALYAVTVLLLGTNTWIIHRVWRLLGSRRTTPEAV